MAENKDSKTCYNVDTKDRKYVFVGDNMTVNVYPQKGIAIWFSFDASNMKEKDDFGPSLCSLGLWDFFI
jgi:hypothetical protein